MCLQLSSPLSDNKQCVVVLFVITVVHIHVRCIGNDVLLSIVAINFHFLLSNPHLTSPSAVPLY